MDAEYYRERERTELRMADQATGSEARSIHRELARRYRTLAESSAQHEQPPAQASAGAAHGQAPRGRAPIAR